MFTAEKTDWVCLFVGSLLHVYLLCFSQWKTSILRIIKWLKRALLIGCLHLSSVHLHTCISVHANMCQHASELPVKAQKRDVFGCILIHFWWVGTKADMISCVSVKAGAATQSFMSPHNISQLPVNMLAGGSSSTVLWQMKYFAASVSVLARKRARLFLPRRAVIE